MRKLPLEMSIVSILMDLRASNNFLEHRQLINFSANFRTFFANFKKVVWSILKGAQATSNANPALEVYFNLRRPYMALKAAVKIPALCPKTRK